MRNCIIFKNSLQRLGSVQWKFIDLIMSHEKDALYFRSYGYKNAYILRMYFGLEMLTRRGHIKDMLFTSVFISQCHNTCFINSTLKRPVGCWLSWNLSRKSLLFQEIFVVLFLCINPYSVIRYLTMLHILLWMTVLLRLRQMCYCSWYNE